MSQLILLSILTLTSKIPTLSSKISLGRLASLSKTTSVIFLFKTELMKLLVMDSLPGRPKIRLNT